MRGNGVDRGRRPFLLRLMTLGGIAACSPRGLAGQAPAPRQPLPLPQHGGLIFAGIKGSVVAFEKATGKQAWSTHLSGTAFVNIVLAGADLYASTRGELFCVDAGSGSIRWHSPLKGYGRGLMTIATLEGPVNQAAIAYAELRHREQQAAASQPLIL